MLFTMASRRRKVRPYQSLCSRNDSRGLVICIEDDGVGFQATGDSGQISSSIGGVGLQNVDQRLKLHFGDSYQMRINFCTRKRTTVREIYINGIETS